MCRCRACNKKIEVIEIKDSEGNFIAFDDFCSGCKIASKLYETEVSARRNERIIPDPAHNFSQKLYVGNQSVSENWLN